MGVSSLESPLHAERERLVFRRMAWRILPLLTLAYIVNFLDRTNVGFAALTMNARRRPQPRPSSAPARASCSWATACSRLPSNVALHRFGARIWLSRIMITWGAVSMATVFVAGPKSFYGLRFLLGVAEAGFFPGAAFLPGPVVPGRSSAPASTPGS